MLTNAKDTARELLGLDKVNQVLNYFGTEAAPLPLEPLAPKGE